MASSSRRAILAKSAEQFDECKRLIEELLIEIDSKDDQIEKLRLDYESNSNSRMSFQLQLRDIKQEIVKLNCPFVMMLVDADGYLFRKELLNKPTGGEEAADILNDAIQQLMKDSDLGLDVVIHVKAFANIDGLGRALKGHGTVTDSNQMRQFASGFSSRKGLYDFVDVGSGKEKADHKLRANISAFAKNPQCKQIVLACGHDGGYATTLRELAGDVCVKGRITLVEGIGFLQEIQSLGFRTTKFDTVFESEPQTAPSPVLRTAWTKPGFIQSGVNNTNSVLSGPNKETLISRFEVLVVNGRRVDKKLQRDKAIYGQMKAGNYCFHYHLKGSCTYDYCPNRHHPSVLSEQQLDALFEVARDILGPHKDGRGSVCREPFCMFSHGGK